MIHANVAYNYYTICILCHRHVVYSKLIFSLEVRFENCIATSMSLVCVTFSIALRDPRLHAHCMAWIQTQFPLMECRFVASMINNVLCEIRHESKTPATTINSQGRRYITAYNRVNYTLKTLQVSNHPKYISPCLYY